MSHFMWIERKFKILNMMQFFEENVLWEILELEMKINFEDGTHCSPVISRTRTYKQIKSS